MPHKVIRAFQWFDGEHIRLTVPGEFGDFGKSTSELLAKNCITAAAGHPSPAAPKRSGMPGMASVRGLPLAALKAMRRSVGMR